LLSTATDSLVPESHCCHPAGVFARSGIAPKSVDLHRSDNRVLAAMAEWPLSAPLDAVLF